MALCLRNSGFKHQVFESQNSGTRDICSQQQLQDVRDAGADLVAPVIWLTGWWSWFRGGGCGRWSLLVVICNQLNAGRGWVKRSGCWRLWFRNLSSFLILTVSFSFTLLLWCHCFEFWHQKEPNGMRWSRRSHSNLPSGEDRSSLRLADTVNLFLNPVKQVVSSEAEWLSTLTSYKRVKYSARWVWRRSKKVKFSIFLLLKLWAVSTYR